MYCNQAQSVYSAKNIRISVRQKNGLFLNNDKFYALQS